MRKLYLIVLLIFLQGCGFVYARFTYDFDESKKDQRIYYEPGVEDLASEISEGLNEYVSVVEESQYRAFSSIDELKIFVFSDKGRYANYSSSSPKARGSASTNEIYISPIIADRRETLSSIVIHELSHVHIRQYIGTWRYWAEVPGWFLEGLAVEVSGGGGAERVSDAEAIKSIQSGVHFTPREESDNFGHKYAHDYGLKPHLYYRQSNLFVRYLKEINPDAFKRSYLSLIDGKEFSEIWLENYGKRIPDLWADYLRLINAQLSSKVMYLSEDSR